MLSFFYYFNWWFNWWFEQDAWGLIDGEKASGQTNGIFGQIKRCVCCSYLCKIIYKKNCKKIESIRENLHEIGKNRMNLKSKLDDSRAREEWIEK